MKNLNDAEKTFILKNKTMLLSLFEKEKERLVREPDLTPGEMSMIRLLSIDWIDRIKKLEENKTTENSIDVNQYV
jgi:hypothetical protein